MYRIKIESFELQQDQKGYSNEVNKVLIYEQLALELDVKALIIFLNQEK